MKKMNLALKTVGILGLGLLVGACSSTNKSASVENGFGGANAQGIGTEGGFVNSDYMAKLLGINKNTIYFDFDKTYVKAEYQNIIDANVKYLKDHASAKVRLEGNTDPVGSREYNIGLGQRRASSVAQQLQAAGVSPNQIVTVSYGQERPAVSGNTPEAYSLDRRVDIVYITK
jgi:peptidoglycan-associated lipoprotein